MTVGVQTLAAASTRLFSPEENLTRAQVAVLIARGFYAEKIAPKGAEYSSRELETPRYAMFESDKPECRFGDVPRPADDDPNRDKSPYWAIQMICHRGITRGCNIERNSSGQVVSASFCPADPIHRWQLAIFMGRLLFEMQ